MSLNGHRCIGICLTQIQENLPNDFVHSVIKRAGEYGFKVLIYNSFSDFYVMGTYDKGESRVFDLVRYDILDGLIVLPESIKDQNILDKIITCAKEHNICTVCVDKRIDGCYNIEYNYRSAFEAIVRHVVEKHNCRTINIVAGVKDNPFSDERIACCRKVLNNHGLELDDNRIMYGDFWADPTARAFDEFMQSGLEMPDAFVCCNDSMALTICSKLLDYGYRVPDDVIVTGFDGILEERYHIPRLTTANQNVELAGEKAVDIIAASLEGRASDNFSVIDHRVVWSHSCGCKPIDYRETTGQISPLFKQTADDNMFDTLMFEFNTKASAANTLDELSYEIYYYANPYNWFYYGLNLMDDFMNISSKKYEKFINHDDDDEEEKRLILCESVRDKIYKPYYSDGFDHFDEALETVDVFMFWSVHFQEKYIGYGAMGFMLDENGNYYNGDFRHIVKYTRDLNRVLEISNSQSVLEKVIAKLQDLYIHDLTGLYNRRGFYSEIANFITEAREHPDKQTHMIIISVDMDGLKTINDTYGHSEGDVAIKAIADALISIWGGHEICSRFGGDEFTVASVCTDDPDAKSKELVDKIQAYLDRFNENSGKPYKVKSSFGIHHEVIGKDFVVDNLIKIADDLMYKEKSTHKESRCRSTVRK